MPTNSDKWFVGMLPVSKAFYGETQVYPVDDGGGDGGGIPPCESVWNPVNGARFLFRYSKNVSGVSKVTTAGTYRKLRDGSDSPVYVEVSNVGHIGWCLNEGFPTGQPTINPNTYSDAIGVQKLYSNKITSQKNELRSVIQSYYPMAQAPTLLLEEDPGPLYQGELVGGFPPNANFNGFYYCVSTPDNPTLPGKYTLSCALQTSTDGYDWSPDPDGYFYYDWIVISDDPILSFAPTTFGEGLKMMREQVAEGFITQEDIDEVSNYGKERGLL